MLQIKFGALSDLESMLKASTLNLSPGGMFIFTDQPRPVGQRVEIEIPFSNPETIRITGVVRHIRYVNSRAVGMGIEFDELSTHTRHLIEKLIQRAEGSDR